jgi:hypothetical protein
VLVLFESFVSLQLQSIRTWVFRKPFLQCLYSRHCQLVSGSDSTLLSSAEAALLTDDRLCHMFGYNCTSDVTGKVVQFLG